MKEKTMQRRTRVSAVGIVRRNREILLCRLAHFVTGYAGQWTLPGGGLDFGEPPRDGLIREIKEETGLNAYALEALDVSSDLVTHPEDDLEVHAIRLVYRATVDEGLLVPETNGSTDLARWISVDSVMDLPLVAWVRRVLVKELERSK